MNIVTTGFVDGVEAQSESLGFEPGVVYVIGGTEAERHDAHRAVRQSADR